MRIVGLCGRSGSGKSVFSAVARRMDIPVVDCDKIYHSLVSRRTPCLDEIELGFGKAVIENDALNRKALSKIVFSDGEKLQKLNEITHKHILRSVGETLSRLDAPLAILDAPTLFESGAYAICDTVVSVVASDGVSVSRIMSRDGLTESAARARLASQKPLDFLIENSDIVVYNEASLSDFETASREVLTALAEGRL